MPSWFVLIVKCFYHPNPMTKPAGTPRKKPDARRRRLNSQAEEVNLSSAQGRLTSLALSPPSLRSDIATPTTSWPTPPESVPRMTQPRADSTRNFYLGSTSYASVFTNEHGLPDSVHEQPSERLSITPSMPARIGNRHCQFGVGQSIISALTPFSFYEKSTRRYFESHRTSALVGPLILSALPQLREDLETLANAGTIQHTLYAFMTKNSASPLKIPSTMPASKFHTLCVGENLRWEMLGLILAIAGFNAQTTSPSDELFTLDDGTKIDRDELIEKYLLSICACRFYANLCSIICATNDCINICNIHGAVNDSKSGPITMFLRSLANK